MTKYCYTISTKYSYKLSIMTIQWSYNLQVSKWTEFSSSFIKWLNFKKEIITAQFRETFIWSEIFVIPAREYTIDNSV